MPNTPAQIGQGISVWTASQAVTADQRELARRILTALGQEIFVEDEGLLDMATALSGTGPAYVFLFMEALVDAGVHLGFPRRISEALVLQTLRGSVEYYAQKKDHPAHLRNEVTSPGGTSAAALVLPGKSRLPHRHQPGDLGRLRAVSRTGARQDQHPTGETRELIRRLI